MQDLYAEVYSLRDYLNTYANLTAVINNNRIGSKWSSEFTFEELRKALDESPIKTIEECYGEVASLMTEIIEHPQKVARLNRLAEIANSCKDIAVFKQVRNEVNRLLFQNDRALPYPEPEFCPDLLLV